MRELAGLLVECVVAACCSALAVRRGRPRIPWLIAGLVGGIFAIMVLLVMPKQNAVRVP